MTPSTRAGTPATVIAFITAISLMLSLFASVTPVIAHHGGTHPLVQPTTFPGPANRTCGDVDQADYEFKVNVQNPNGTYKKGSGGVSVTPDAPTDFEVTIETTTVSGQKLLSFSSNLPVQSVFLKGGVNGSNLYDYAEWPTAASPQPVTYDENLQVPGGTDISHVSFCFDELPLFPKLEISKTPDAGTVNAGDPIAFGITVTNSGDAAATNVEIADSLPAGFAWSADHANCSVTGTALTCVIASLAAKASFTVNVQAPTDGTQCGPFPNVASASADGQQAVTDGGQVTINCADIDVDKTPDAGAVDAGELATFTITVSNLGEGTAHGVELRDQLPATAAGWTVFSSDWPAAPAAGACEISAGLLECGPVSLAAGGSIAVVVQARTTVDDCGLLDNPIARVTTANDGWDEDGGAIAVLCPELSILKSTTTPEVNAGDTVSYTISLQNGGDGPAHDVLLTDQLPGDIAWSVDEAGCVIVDSELSCAVGTLASGASFSVTVTGTAGTGDCPSIANTASFTSSNAGSGSTPEVRIAVDCPGLNMVKTADADSVVAGETASYTITVWNSGPGAASGVTVEDTIPADWTFDDSVCDSAASSLEEGGMQNWSCTIDSLGVSDMAGGIQIRIWGPTTRDDCGLLTNTAFASASNLDGKLEASDTIVVVCPELILDKAADTDEIVISGPTDDQQADPAVLTWTLSYTPTDGPVTNAVITDELPVGLVYVPDSASHGGVYDAGTNTLTWTFPTLSESGSVTYRTAVDPETISRVGPTVNVAVISSDQTPEDEGRDEVSVIVDAPPLAGTPTPRPREGTLPDTATAFGPNGEPITIPVELLMTVVLGSLGALALANARAARSRRR